MAIPPEKGVWVPVLECEEARVLMNEDDPGSLDADILTVVREGQLVNETTPAGCFCLCHPLEDEHIIATCVCCRPAAVERS